MARLLTEIYNLFITEKETHAELDTLVPNPDTAQTFLDDLTSTSKVAIWRLWYFSTAVGIKAHEEVFDDHKAELEAFADTLIGGNARWLQQECFKFQLGDALVFNSTTLKFGYAVLDTAKQIIKRCAVIEIGGQVRIKVAKEDGGGNPVELTASELSAFDNYINNIKFAGTSTLVTSLPADQLRIFYDLHYDPSILASDGTLISDGVTKPVENAINNYVSNLPFNGILNLTELTDAVQAAQGVTDPVLTDAEARFGVNPFVDIDREYLADAGYMEVDPGTPLSSSITYIADPQ